MRKNPSKDAPADLVALLREIVSGSEILANQQLELLRCELRAELGRAGEAVVFLGVGASLVATGGVISAVALVHAIHRVTRLPFWCCYGLCGGLLGAAGAGLLATGKERVVSLRLPPPHTTSALRENFEWLKEQVS